MLNTINVFTICREQSGLNYHYIKVFGPNLYVMENAFAYNANNVCAYKIINQKIIQYNKKIQ